MSGPFVPLGSDALVITGIVPRAYHRCRDRRRSVATSAESGATRSTPAIQYSLHAGCARPAHRTSRCRRLLDPPLARRMTAVGVARLRCDVGESALNAVWRAMKAQYDEECVARGAGRRNLSGRARRHLDPGV